MTDCTLNSLVADSDEQCINTIRALCIDAIQKANSGHPGAPMGLAPAAYILFAKFLKHNPKNPDWFNRDRFILSGGHGSMLLYSLLYLMGYDLDLDDIKSFRQWESKTPGHPEFMHTPGVETTTGPLGQGFANAVGMAIVEQHLSAVYNQPEFPIIDHYTYMMCGDGDLMEGISYEAASLAGHLGLGKLICIYDNNQITIEGRTEITFTENVAARFKAMNWHVLEVDDGNNYHAIANAMEASKTEKNQPSIIILSTQIAYGSPNKQNTSDAHGAPLGEEEIRLTKKNLGCVEDADFCIPDKVIENCRKSVELGGIAETDWTKICEKYEQSFPQLSDQLNRAIKGEIPSGWDANIPVFKGSDAPVATRACSGNILNTIAEKYPDLMGGSADLDPSTKTYIKASFDYQKNAYDGRNIRFGVREHSMAAILSGMALHKGVRPFGSTFLVFSDYMRPSIRLAAMMKLPVIYVFTHDSIAVGEDGPTHQPVEHIPALRLIPGLTVVRPADATETAAAWKYIIQNPNTPTALILSRQKLPIIDREKYAAADGLNNGAYVLSETNDTPNIIIIATGSEVHPALEAKTQLEEKKISVRVVSMPSCEIFDSMPDSYKHSVLPPEIQTRISIEASHVFGWDRYIGDNGYIIGLNRFGASAPGGVVMEKLGINVKNIVTKGLELLKVQ